MRTGLIALALVCLAPGAVLANPLAPYRWESRLLVVFADDEIDPKLGEQRAILAQDPAGLLERDLVLLEGVGETPISLSGGATEPAALRETLILVSMVMLPCFRASNTI